MYRKWVSKQEEASHDKDLRATIWRHCHPPNMSPQFTGFCAFNGGRNFNAPKDMHHVIFYKRPYAGVASCRWCYSSNIPAEIIFLLSFRLAPSVKVIVVIIILITVNNIILFIVVVHSISLSLPLSLSSNFSPFCFLLLVHLILWHVFYN